MPTKIQICSQRLLKRCGFPDLLCAFKFFFPGNKPSKKMHSQSQNLDQRIIPLILARNCLQSGKKSQANCKATHSQPWCSLTEHHFHIFSVVLTMRGKSFSGQKLGSGVEKEIVSGICRCHGYDNTSVRKLHVLFSRQYLTTQDIDSEQRKTNKHLPIYQLISVYFLTLLWSEDKPSSNQDPFFLFIA